MSIRRRAIEARVKRNVQLQQGFDELSAGLDELRAVIDSFQAEGRKTVSQEEFAVRLHVLRAHSASVTLEKP